MSASHQLGLDLAPRTWGGIRAGAGRKRIKNRRDPEHVARPYWPASVPSHVVLRTVDDVPRLRVLAIYLAIRAAMLLTLRRGAFRIVHMSIQHNHLHLIVEAVTREAMTRGMQGFAIAAARGINRACGRTGKVFAFRYHATPITTPQQARNTLSYVFNNWRKHGEDRGNANARARSAKIDPYSTAIWFGGWKGMTEHFDVPAGFEPLPAANAMTWVLTVGWERYGRIGFYERPGPRPRPRPSSRRQTNRSRNHASSSAGARSAGSSMAMAMARSRQRKPARPELLGFWRQTGSPFRTKHRHQENIKCIKC